MKAFFATADGRFNPRFGSENVRSVRSGATPAHGAPLRAGLNSFEPGGAISEDDAERAASAPFVGELEPPLGGGLAHEHECAG
jgi:hypothetical protein